MIYPPPPCFGFLISVKWERAGVRLQKMCWTWLLHANNQSQNAVQWQRINLVRARLGSIAWKTGMNNSSLQYTETHRQTDTESKRCTWGVGRKGRRGGREGERDRDRGKTDRQTDKKTQRHTPWGAMRKGKGRSSAVLKAKQLLKIFSNMFKFVVKLYWDVYVTL